MCDAFASPAPARCLATCSTVPAIFRGFHGDIDVKALSDWCTQYQQTHAYTLKL
jgi:hypothetical protein